MSYLEVVSHIHRYRKQTCSYQKGKRMWGSNKLGVWDKQIQTKTYKIPKEQGCTV